MKYFAVNQQIENEIRIIKKELNLSMNGVCSEQMELAGVKYGLNYGVSWMRIKQIAANHSQNIELAERLWHMDIRETKLIAPLLTPIEEMTKEMANEWINMIHTQELAETSSMVLFSKLSYIYEIIIENINSANIWAKLATIHTAARCIGQFSNLQINTIYSLISDEDRTNPKLHFAINALDENHNFHKPKL